MVLLRALALWLLVLVSLSQASPAVTWTTVDYPGATSTIGVWGINNLGQMVGGYLDNNGTAHGFIDNNGTFSRVDYPGGTLTVLSGINDFGQMVGSYYDAKGKLNGFYYDGANFTTVDPPNAAYSDLAKINNSGKMVGYYVDQSNASHAFEYDLSSGTFSNLDPPGSNFSSAGGINNLGDVVGQDGTTTNPDLVFLFKGGAYQIIFNPGGFSIPYAINDSGEVVGTLSSHRQRTRAFSYQNGQFVGLRFPGARITFGYGVNNAGAIVGQYAGTTNVSHGFVRTP